MSFDHSEVSSGEYSPTVDPTGCNCLALIILGVCCLIFWILLLIWLI